MQLRVLPKLHCEVDWTGRWLKCKQAHAWQTLKVCFAPDANAADAGFAVHYDDTDKWTKENERTSGL